MICNHYVLINTFGSNKESLTIIIVEFTDGLIPYVELFRFVGWLDIFIFRMFSSVLWFGSFLLPLAWCLVFLVYLTPWGDCTICPFIVSNVCGQYLNTLVYVNRGHLSKCNFLIALSHVDYTGNPAAACI